MVWTDLTDVRCCYAVLGSGDPLLLVPGLGVTAAVWDAAVPALAARFALILPDNRGVGRSAAVRPAESLADYTADLVELMDRLQLDRAHVMGLSLGGMIARRLAADHPSRVARLVLVSCTDRPTPYLTQVMRLLGGVLRRLPAEAFAQVIEALGTAPEFYDANADAIRRRVRERCRAGGGRRAILPQLRCLACEADACREPGPVAAPTLVVAGEYDPLVPACYARAMADRIPGSRFVLVRGAGHNPLAECPDRVVPAIADFLTQQSTGAAADPAGGGGRRPGRRQPRSREEGAARVESIP